MSTKTQLQQQVSQLSPKERIEIADALYDSVEAETLPEHQREILDRRLAESVLQPERFISWDEALSEIRQKLD